MHALVRSTTLKKKPVRYRTHIVTYCDILGFQNLLLQETPGRISRILRVLQEEARHDKEAEQGTFERLYESFSDLTLRTIHVSSVNYLLVRPELLIYELESVANIQCNLIRREGVLVSGGIAVGDLVKSWGLVYGSALVKAYVQAEKAEQAYILLDREVADLLRRIRDGRAGYTTSIDNIVSRDRSNSFVDYLQYASAHSETDELLNFLYEHKNLIESRLAHFRKAGRIREKYLWLKDYHNRKMRTIAPPLEANDLLVS